MVVASVFGAEFSQRINKVGQRFQRELISEPETEIEEDRRDENVRTHVQDRERVPDRLYHAWRSRRVI